MVQDRWPSQDKVDPNTSVNGNLDTLHEAIVVNNVKNLLVEKNLTDLFVSVDKFPSMSDNPPFHVARLFIHIVRFQKKKVRGEKVKPEISISDNVKSFA